MNFSFPVQPTISTRFSHPQTRAGKIFRSRPMALNPNHNVSFDLPSASLFSIPKLNNALMEFFFGTYFTFFYGQVIWCDTPDRVVRHNPTMYRLKISRRGKPNTSSVFHPFSHVCFDSINFFFVSSFTSKVFFSWYFFFSLEHSYFLDPYFQITTSVSEYFSRKPSLKIFSWIS